MEKSNLSNEKIKKIRNDIKNTNFQEGSLEAIQKKLLKIVVQKFLLVEQI